MSSTSPTSELGEPNPVTGTVIVPTAAWKAPVRRPVVTISPRARRGSAISARHRLQIANGTEYDGGAIDRRRCKKGYAVAMTDYPGYTNGALPAYMAGMAEGHAVLDTVNAAQQIPGSGISSSAPVVIWGYSQGGQAAGWAAQLA